MGFNSLIPDPCVYIKGCRESFVILTLYVDDILVTGGSKEAILEVKNTLMAEFSMSHLGDVSETLGIHIINRNFEAGTISFSQEKYVEAIILERFGMNGCKPVSTPGTGRELVVKPEGSEYLDEKETKEYQALIGSLIFLTTNTRCGIAFAVMQTARFMSKPTSGHMVAAKRILRYLSDLTDLRITYSRSRNKGLLGYSLVIRLIHVTGDPERSWSTTINSTIFFLSGGLVHFSSQLQKIAAQSTTEAELIALNSCAKRGMETRSTQQVDPSM